MVATSKEKAQSIHCGLTLLTGTIEAIPRHTEIPNKLAKKIVADYQYPRSEKILRK